MPAQMRVAYRDFSGGEFGEQGILRAPQGTFHGSNLIKSREGYLYPRHGLRHYPSSGLPNTGNLIHGIGWNGTPGADLVVQHGTNFYVRNSADFAGAWVAATGDTLGSEPNEAVPIIESDGGVSYALVPGQGLYRLDHAAGPALTVTQIAAVTADMAGRALGVWLGRLLIGGNTPANRVYYSAELDHDDWPVENFFDAPGKPQVRALFFQRGHLALARQDGSWWVLSALPEQGGTFRKQTSGQHPWHMFQPSAALLADDTIVYAPVQGTWPAAFDGTQVAELRHLEFGDVQGPLSGSVTTLPLGNRDEVVMISGLAGDPGKGAALLEGTWTLFDLETTAPISLIGGGASDQQGYIFLLGTNTSTDAPHVYRLDLRNTGIPGKVSGGDYGDDSDTAAIDTFLNLPGFWSEDGMEFTVRQVIVDAIKFNTGSTTDNTIAVRVDAYSSWMDEGAHTSASQEWVEDPSAASSAGDRFRVFFNVGDQGSGAGAQVRLTQVTGVAIEQVVMVLEATGSLPVE